MSPPKLRHAYVIPQERIAHDLDFARGLGVLTSWRSGRLESADPTRAKRFFEVRFPDGQVLVWGPGVAAAFGLGVRLATEGREGDVDDDAV